jgi:hypothetical protein
MLPASTDPNTARASICRGLNRGFGKASSPGPTGGASSSAAGGAYGLIVGSPATRAG